jgi:uncharacterized delta-60 repeat protein
MDVERNSVARSANFSGLRRVVAYDPSCIWQKSGAVRGRNPFHACRYSNKRKTAMRILCCGLLVLTITNLTHAGSLGPVIDTPYANHGHARIAFDVIAGDRADTANAGDILSDGSVVLGGTADMGSAQPQFALARFRPDGAADTNFGDGQGRTILNLIPAGGSGRFRELAVTTAGQIALIADYTAGSAGTAPTFLAIGRFNGNGAPDSGFNLGGFRFIGMSTLLADATNAVATSILPAADDSIFAAGIVVSSAKICSAVIHLTPSGNLDTQFGGGSGSFCYTSDATPFSEFVIVAMAIQSDGKILLAGQANHGVGGSNEDFAVLRVMANGNIDTTFGTGGWSFVPFDQGGGLDDFAEAITIDAQSRIILAGRYQTAQGSDWAVARLLANGQLDMTFASGGRLAVGMASGSESAEANAINVLPDGRMLIGGYTYLSGYTGPPGLHVVAPLAAAAMLMPNGILDTRFGTGGKFIESNNSTPYDQVILDPRRQRLAGEYLYLPGTTFKPDGSDTDYGVERLALPLFYDGFESN